MLGASVLVQRAHGLFRRRGQWEMPKQVPAMGTCVWQPQSLEEPKPWWTYVYRDNLINWCHVQWIRHPWPRNLTFGHMKLAFYVAGWAEKAAIGKNKDFSTQPLRRDLPCELPHLDFQNSDWTVCSREDHWTASRWKYEDYCYSSVAAEVLATSGPHNPSSHICSDCFVNVLNRTNY